jgi:hypothetical protein
MASNIHAALGDNVHPQGKMIHQISFAAAVAVIVAVLVLR